MVINVSYFNRTNLMLNSLKVPCKFHLHGRDSQFLIWYMFIDDLKISLPFSYEDMVNYAGNYPYFSVTVWKCAQF